MNPFSFALRICYGFYFFFSGAVFVGFKSAGKTRESARKMDGYLGSSPWISGCGTRMGVVLKSGKEKEKEKVIDKDKVLGVVLGSEGGTRSEGLLQILSLSFG